MRTAAILPVKGFDGAKQRLAHGLSPGPRRALAEAMFADVLVALRRTRGVETIVVVSSDPGAQRLAGGYGIEVLGDDDRGHNPAARRGIEHAVVQGAERVLLVPGDCPLLDPGELDDLLSAERPAPCAVIIPDRHGTGTNALLITPPSALEPSFGEGSCRRHLDLAAAAGTRAEVGSVPSLAMDVDTPEDLEALEQVLSASRGGAARTRGMINQLSRSRGQR